MVDPEPKPLVMISMGYCDFCKQWTEDEENTRVFTLCFNWRLGWQVCMKPECSQRAEEIYNRYVPVNPFGNQKFFSVRRSSGAIDNNWVIEEGPISKIRDNTDPSKILFIMKPSPNEDYIFKTLSLQSLLALNTPHACAAPLSDATDSLRLLQPL